MTAAIADTSIFLALEAGRPLRPFQGSLRISIATLTELELGVLMANDRAVRRVRTATLASARAHAPIPYDEPVSTELARIVADLRRAKRRVGVFDAIIAATALVTGLPVYTQDPDFEVVRDHAGGPELVLG